MLTLWMPLLFLCLLAGITVVGIGHASLVTSLATLLRVGAALFLIASLIGLSLSRVTLGSALFLDGVDLVSCSRLLGLALIFAALTGVILVHILNDDIFYMSAASQTIVWEHCLRIVLCAARSATSSSWRSRPLLLALGILFSLLASRLRLPISFLCMFGLALLGYLLQTILASVLSCKV